MTFDLDLAVSWLTKHYTANKIFKTRQIYRFLNYQMSVFLQNRSKNVQNTKDYIPAIIIIYPKYIMVPKMVKLTTPKSIQLDWLG